MGCCGSSAKEETSNQDDCVDERTNLLSSQSHLSNTNRITINGEASGPPLNISDDDLYDDVDTSHMIQTRLGLITLGFEKNVIVSLEDKITFLPPEAMQHKNEIYRAIKEKLQNEPGMVLPRLPPSTPRVNIAILTQPLLRSPITQATRNDFSQAMAHLNIINLTEPVIFEASELETHNGQPV